MATTQTALFAQVILDVSIGRLLEYQVPPHLIDQIKVGCQVKVPLRGHLRIGYIFSLSPTPSYKRALPIDSLNEQAPSITQKQFELALWMSRYYCVHLGQVMKSMLPSCVRKQTRPKEQKWVIRARSRAELQQLCSSLQTSVPAQAKVLEALLPVRKGILLTELLEKAGVSASPVKTLEKQGALKITTIELTRSPLAGASYFKSSPKDLNDEQQVALNAISENLEAHTFGTHLLFGVTGSGKTEVYLQAIEKAVAQKKQALMLVPEIALTTQTIERFQSRFDHPMAILHHRLSEGERFDEWRRIHKGEVSIVIGARSALFSPLENLGLIIVDEEHDGAYKQQEESFCYHARDVAVVYGKMLNATVILGSATPSIESFHNAKKGKYHLLPLTKRPGAFLPKVDIVDMRREFERAKGFTLFSEKLLDEIQKRLEKGEQAVLFLNRRGYHSSYFCEACGHIMGCPHCSVALTYHKHKNQLACHLCDYTLTPPRECPQCRQTSDLKFRGVGTEMVERSLNALFPEVRTLRMDADTTRHKGAHDLLFQQFRTQKADVLIGTQMIAKGLHFPGVTLVAVLNADSTLQIPDFRASEHLFQLITQVAGRSGRGHLPGEVIIQTHQPENPTIQLASQQDFQTFYNQEIEARSLFGYPPFTHFVKIQISSNDCQAAENIAFQLQKECQKYLEGGIVHPAVPSGYPKIKDRFRFHFLMRHPNPFAIGKALKEPLSNLFLKKEMRIQIDVDPLSTYF